jgi:hypothetical protein
MSMTLESKLASIPNTQFISELNAMLDKASLNASCDARLLVDVEGYAGMVELNDLAKKYFSLPTPFNQDSSAPLIESLIEKMEHYKLGKKILDLYSYEKRLEIVIPGPNRLPGLLSIKTDVIFSFTRTEFKKLFPNTLPTTIFGSSYIASKKMVDDLIGSILL